MAALGDLLRDTREARGISLGDAERETKIRAKYITALEDENVAALPGAVYARGFLRNYASYLGLDVEEVLDLYDKATQPTRARLRVARGEPAPKIDSSERISIQPLSPQSVDTRVRYGSSYIAVSLIAVPLLILFYFIYSIWGGSRSANVPIPTPRPPTLTPLVIPTQNLAGGGAGLGGFNTPTVPVALPPGAPITATLALPGGTPVPGAASPVTGASPVPSNTIAVKVTTTRDAWMRVLVDGVQQYNGTLRAGSNRTWVGKKTVRIRTGRADSVNVNVNGQDRGLMSLGDNLVVEKEWDPTGTERLIR